MKLITAIIKPHKLDAVREALSREGIQGITVAEVKGFGRQKGHKEVYRGAEYRIEFVPKTRMDIVIDDSQLESVIQAIRNAANTNSIGDGKLFVSTIEDVMRIRTGETGVDAL